MMNWISNGDPPIYVWNKDTWYNQKDKLTYFIDNLNKGWRCEDKFYAFTKKTKFMK